MYVDVAIANRSKYILICILLPNCIAAGCSPVMRNNIMKLKLKNNGKATTK